MTAPELLQAEMPLIRRIRASLAELGYNVCDAEYFHMFDVSLAYYRKFGWTVEK